MRTRHWLTVAACLAFLLVGIPATEALHEPTDVLSIFGGHKSPTDPACIDFIERKQIEFAFRLLRLRQDEPFFFCIASPPIGFDGGS